MKENKIVNATKWTVISEVIAKLIAPITTIVLSRLLAKEVFGIVASITILTSLSDLLADAGFNAYIVQHQFDKDEKEQDTYNVCFWSNFTIAITLFTLLVIFRDFFAEIVGAEGYGIPLVVAAIIIPLTSMSSIGMAVMQKKFKFKKLGIIKIISKLIPFIITIPLALLGFKHWSLIIGTVIGEIFNCCLVLILGNYRPTFFYKFSILKKIFKFSSWAYLESILEWLLANIAIIFIGNIYGLASLGLFKTSTTLIIQIITSIYALYGKVYKSAISENQNDQKKFESIMLTFQKYTSIFSIPLAIGIFLYSDLATNFLLGPGWEEASLIIGLWGLIGSLSIIIGNFYSDAIRAKGKPIYLVFIDLFYLFGIGILLFNSKYLSFTDFCILYCIIKIIQPLLQIIIGTFICKVNIFKFILNDIPQLLSALVMSLFIICFNFNELNGLIGIGSVFCCILIYFASYFIFMPNKKEKINSMKAYFLKK